MMRSWPKSRGMCLLGGTKENRLWQAACPLHSESPAMSEISSSAFHPAQQPAIVLEQSAGTTAGTTRERRCYVRIGDFKQSASTE